MQKTANYGLNKPDQTDFYEIGDFNENMDIIDSKLKEVEDQEIPVATETQNGLMSSEMVTKLDGVAIGANETIVVDNLTTSSATSALSAGQGKVLKEGLDQVNTNIFGEGDGNMSLYEMVKAMFTKYDVDFTFNILNVANLSRTNLYTCTLKGTVPNDGILLIGGIYQSTNGDIGCTLSVAINSEEKEIITDTVSNFGRFSLNKVNIGDSYEATLTTGTTGTANEKYFYIFAGLLY